MAYRSSILATALAKQYVTVCRRTRTMALAPMTRARWFSDEAGESSYSNEYFGGLVADKPLVVFMKGEPSAPMCGFSRLVVQILHMHGVEKYEHYDVLKDIDFKEGMKKYSNWPTFPQVYFNGELMGGADIMLQMHQSGDLVTELDKIGHRSALLDKQKEPEPQQ